MTTSELTNLWEDIENIINAPTKAEAKLLVSHLRIQTSKIKADINNPYFKNKLDEVIIYAEEASGRVKNKEQMASSAKQSWYVFKNKIKINENT